MNTYQKYFLIAVYFYINFYATLEIFKLHNKTISKKLFFIAMLWGIPYLGYLYMMIKVIHQPEVNIPQFKNSKTFEFNGDLKTVTWSNIVYIVLTYSFLYIILGYTK